MRPRRRVPVRFPDASAEWLGEVTGHLRSARHRLLARSALELAGTLGRAAERFLDPADPLRREALEHLPGTSGLSAEMAAAVLDGMAADWTVSWPDTGAVCGPWAHPSPPRSSRGACRGWRAPPS